MPMYMDIHEVKGATAADVAKAHIADVKTQGEVRRRISQVLVKREHRQDFLPVQRAEPGSGGLGAS